VQVANKDGVSQQAVQGEISKIHGETSGAFKGIKSDNQARNNRAKTENETKLEQAESNARSAQPLERAENNLPNFLKPPKDR
jgi:hypothetical protein